MSKEETGCFHQSLGTAGAGLVWFHFFEKMPGFGRTFRFSKKNRYEWRLTQLYPTNDDSKNVRAKSSMKLGVLKSILGEHRVY